MSVVRSVRGAAVLAVALVLLPACGGAVSDEYERGEEPYRIEPVEGSPFARVILEPEAVERLGIETAPVETEGELLVVPAEAVYLDADGSFWVFTNPEPNVYVRQTVRLVRETGTVAFLRDGLDPGTEVVTIGIPELLGAETGFGT